MQMQLGGKLGNIYFLSTRFVPIRTPTFKQLKAPLPCSAFDRESCTFRCEPINIPNSQDVTSFIFSNAETGTSSEKIALIDGTTGTKLTFKSTQQMVFRFVEKLKFLGVQPGNVVMILSPNSILYPIVMLATMSLGAITATPNPLGTLNDVEHQARLTNAKFAFTTKELLHKVEKLGLPTVLLEELEDYQSGPDSVFFSSTESCLEDPAAVLYSSGTTGFSKGVVISHKNIIAQILQLENATSRADKMSNQEEVHLCALPMSHVFGSVVVTLHQLHSGHPTVVLPGFELQTLINTIEQYKVSHIYVVPPLVVMLAKTLLQNKSDEIERLGSLRSIFCGAAPLGKELIATCTRLLPNTTFTQIYGLTECTGAATFNLVENRSNDGCVGTLLGGMEAKVVDVSSSKNLPPNEHGELLIRGPTTMTGYMNDPKGTSLALSSDGWLRTGDLVYFDSEGRLYVVDRIKELIKYKALQVAPAELEAVLLTHPQILDAAVVPYPSKDAGQIPMAFVVQTQEAQLTEDDVKAFVAKRVAPYKRVRRVAFTNVIQKTASGKILRKELIKQISML